VKGVDYRKLVHSIAEATAEPVACGALPPGGAVILVQADEMRADSCRKPWRGCAALVL